MENGSRRLAGPARGLAPRILEHAAIRRNRKPPSSDPTSSGHLTPASGRREKRLARLRERGWGEGWLYRNVDGSGEVTGACALQ